MTDFILYLHLDHENNFIWTQSRKLRKQIEKSGLKKEEKKGPSRLDFNVASGESFELAIGDSLINSWRFDSREINKLRKCPIKVKDYIHTDDMVGNRKPGQCSFRYKATKTSIVITDFESDNPYNNEFDMYLENFAKDKPPKKDLITKIIIDPIIKNDGSNGPGNIPD